MKPPVSAVCVGDNCIDFYLPPINRQYVGGNAVNVAVHLQRGGISTAYVGVVGNDVLGDLTLKRLSEQGLDISKVKVLPGKTAITHILLNSLKERQFVYEYFGPQPSLKLDDLAFNFIQQHSLVHNTMSGGTETYLPMFKREKNLIVSLDYGERSEPDFIARTISNVDWAFFSTTHTAVDEVEAFGREMLLQGPSLVVVTLGADGSIAVDGDVYFQPAFPVQAVDTLGAGDAFIGTFLAKRLLGFEIPKCLESAALIAAETCTHFGGWMQNENQIINISPETLIVE